MIGYSIVAGALISLFVDDIYAPEWLDFINCDCHLPDSRPFNKSAASQVVHITNYFINSIFFRMK